MISLLVGGVVALAGALALAAGLQSRRFARKVGRDARSLLAQPPLPPAERTPLGGLPEPVRRYLEVSGAARRPPIRTVRLTHGGTFLVKAGAAPLPIRGVQYFTADPPGFVWWGRVRAGPGIWIDARDQAVNGAGHMLVRAESAVTLADVRGPELDQGALLRLLGEATWLPTVLRDPRFVTWAPVDAASARATLRVGGREVTATFHFGADGLPTRFTAERHRLVDGRSVLTPFSGISADFREVDGVLVPFRMTAVWHLETGPLPYARWEVERVELDPASGW